MSLSIVCLEGHFYITDETGTEVKAEKGDVFMFAKGSRIVFRTDGYGVAFFVGLKERGTGSWLFGGSTRGTLSGFWDLWVGW